ncbi:hypothetical protein M422DRAFT_264746 [Sphaerobolus stellatus SS14]|uniref:Uncharacterized protein n=1 Tax=Sphaerobolus stellatus (strain SS14) TaxID=990650 RepID=A0A0C9TSU0_SPHS4|nr:hypothetical protein M422DRAFT_264746 [Sphaerobolus stellatus SS14]
MDGPAYGTADYRGDIRSKVPFVHSACGRSMPPSTSDANPSEASRTTNIVAEKQDNFAVWVFHNDMRSSDDV